MTSAPQPRFLAGRQTLLEEARALMPGLERAEGPAGWLLQGQGGSGKSSLLQALRQGWEAQGGACAWLEARPGRSLAAALYPGLRELLYRLESRPATGGPVSQALGALASFRQAHLPALPAPPADPPAQAGRADSGDLESDLASLLETCAEAGLRSARPLALLADEVQALEAAELEALLRAPLPLKRRGLPLVLVAAGLPFAASLGEDLRALARRLYEERELPPLDERALAELLASRGLRLEAAAPEELLKQSRGLPAQVLAWVQSAEKAGLAKLDRTALGLLEPAALALLDARIFGPRFHPLSPREKAYLRSMAHLGPGPHRSGDIADSMDAKITALGPLRAGLLRKGLTYSPAYGLLAFAMPGFDAFLRRAMPRFR